MEKSYKCQTSDDSYIDSLFIIFSQSFLINKIKEYIDVNKAIMPNVLEIGCYNGRLMKFLVQNRIFVNYTGVDVRKKYLDKSAINKRKDSKLLCEDVTQSLSVENDSIDVCVSTEVLEHINESHWSSIFEKLNSKMKKNGWLLLGLPVNNEKLFHSLEREKNVGHVNFPVHSEFIKLIESKSFKLMKYFPGFTINSSYRFTKEIKDSKLYKTLRERLGSPVARAAFLAMSDDFTGGGYYIFKKIDNFENKSIEIKEIL